jgi:hypothetical protein
MCNQCSTTVQCRICARSRTSMRGGGYSLTKAVDGVDIFTASQLFASQKWATERCSGDQREAGKHVCKQPQLAMQESCVQEWAARAMRAANVCWSHTGGGCAGCNEMDRGWTDQRCFSSGQERLEAQGTGEAIGTNSNAASKDEHAKSTSLRRRSRDAGKSRGLTMLLALDGNTQWD